MNKARKVSSTPHCRTRNLIRRWDGVVDIDRKTRIGWRDISGEGHLGWISGPATSNLDLGAGDVPLGRADDVKAHLFNADQIFTRRCVGRNRGSELGCIHVSEGERVESSTPFCNLEPVSTASVPAGGRAGGFAEVDSSRALMIDRVVELEADRAACRDGNGGGCHSGVGIAPDVVRRNILNRGVVHRLTNGGS